MDEEEFPSMAELFWVVAFPYTTLVSDDICLVLP